MSLSIVKCTGNQCKDVKMAVMSLIILKRGISFLQKQSVVHVDWFDKYNLQLICICVNICALDWGTNIDILGNDK